MKQEKKSKSYRRSVTALAVTGFLGMSGAPLLAQQSQQNQPSRGQWGSGQYQQNPQQGATGQRAAGMQSLVTAESVLDSDVYDNNNRKIGEVENLFINPQTGQIQRVGIEFDLDGTIRDRSYSLTWDQFRMMRRNGGDLALMVDESVVQRVRQAGAITAAQLTPAQMSEVQQRLNAQGFQAGNVNGQWNQQTQSAIRNFQQSQGLQATGQLNEQTLEELGLNAGDYRQRR